MSDAIYSEWKRRIESELRAPAAWSDLGFALAPGLHIGPIHVSAPDSSGSHMPPEGPLLYEPVARSAADVRALRQLDDDLSGPAVIHTDEPVEALRGAEDLTGLIVRTGHDSGIDAAGRLLSVARERRAIAATGLLIDPLYLALFGSDDRKSGDGHAPGVDSIRAALLEMGRSGAGNGVPFGCVDAVGVERAGASPTTVVAWTLVSLSAWLDRLEPSDLEPGGRIRRIRILVPVGNRPIIDSAILTSIRDMTTNLVLAYSAENRGPDRPLLPTLHAMSSPDGIVKSVEPSDDAGNLVRATLQAVAASSAGADILSLMPHDAHREPTSVNLRLAAGVHRLLRHESRLDATALPLSGSYAYETMIQALSSAAGKLFREFSEAGEDTARLRSSIRDRIRADRTGASPTVRVGLDMYVPEDELDAP